MSTEYLLIDFENVIPKLIPGLAENQKILIFTGSKQSKINRDLVISTQPYGKQIEWIVIDGTGKNAADFHIAYFIGVYSEREPDALFTILSRDTGFDPLIKYLVLKGVNCKRIDGITKFNIQKVILNKPKVITKKTKDKSVDEIVHELQVHFLKCDKKVRPKKTSKFSSFVKSQGNFDDGTVKAVIAAMIDNGMIEIQDEKITYLLEDVPF